MGEITTVGIDLAKNVFSVHGVDAHGKTVQRKTVSRGALLELMAQLPRCLVGMEACSRGVSQLPRLELYKDRRERNFQRSPWLGTH